MAKERMTRALTRDEFSREAIGYIDHLYRVAVHLVKETQEAEDLVQETYARALGSYEQFAAGSNLKAWLTRILYNFFFDNYHQKKRWVSVESNSSKDTESAYWEKVPADNPGPESHLLLKELSTKISDALRKIPEEFRLPITLVDMGDFSYAEAAEILSCPIGTVRSRLSRGRRLLFNQLKEYVATEEKKRAKR
jgi:RNA polymerase sigma-70 factor (ECF subfamily)